MPNDDVIQDVIRKIERERVLINAATAMRHSTNNSAVQSQADEQIREAKRHIKYFEETLNKLRMQGGMSDLSLGANGGPPQIGPSGGRNSLNGAPATTQYAGYGAPGPGQSYENQLNSGQGYMPPRAPFSPPAPGMSPSGRPTYSRLDLIKYDTPHLGPRIQLMLSQLEFKLSVEKQYKDGIEKIMGAYKMDGDRKSRADAEGRRVESLQKIQLLQRALKHYEDLHVDSDALADPKDDDSLNAPSMRKPLTGHLTVRVHAVSDVTHASSGRYSRGPETYVIMKVEDDFKGRTKASRNDRWTDESHEMDIDKGNEIELTVYDKGSGAQSTPIGMLWIRMADIAEEMRRKKIELEFNNAGWVSADKMEDGRPLRPDLQFNPPPTQQNLNPNSPQAGFGSSPNVPHPQTQPVTIDGWFSLEPVGRIQLSLSFIKQTRERKVFDAGLNRKGAIRQRKEEVHELYGHKFVEQQFYNIMRCALCGELLKYAVGMQCADCKYMCHEKCYALVVTKCISKSNSESDPDETKLKHRIPHRFEVFGNMGANWCCHCGYILPLGKKSCRRCKECKLTSHAHCTHLVPDLCGMPMKRANEILREIRAAEQRPGAGNTPSLRPSKPPKPSATLSYSGTPVSEVPPQRNSYGDPIYETMPVAPKPGALGAAREAFTSTQLPSQASQQYQSRPPLNPRAPSLTQSASADAAAAAASALSKRSPSQNPSPTLYKSPSDFGRPQGGSSSSNGKSPQQNNMPAYDPGVYSKWSQQPPQIPPIQSSSPLMTSPRPAPATSMSQALVNQQFPPMEQRPQPTSAPVTTRPTGGSGKTRVGLDHFNFLAVLGKGNFGKVMLAETKSSKQLYAIKVLKKEFIIENDEVESTKSEKEVFLIANKERHPFLLNLHACFQTETRVYFVMEYISGGDLMLHIQRGQFGTKRAQFYAAEVCLALKYFHENGVIYRDLKLDNILLTLDGHIKIADYGLCKKDMWYGNTTSTFCGTPEFMAPEILLDKRYGRAVDWWAFGVLIYQMLLQQSPFRGEDEDEIYDAILGDPVLYPIHMPRDSVSILQRLLTREPELRLGSGPTDAQEIMSHPFFKNVNWDDIYHKKAPAPFQPSIKNPTDTSNFDSEFTSVTPVLTPVQSVLNQAMQEEFRGFSYAADFI